MTELGDSLKDKGKKHTGVGITRILGSGEQSKLKQYSMGALPMKVMDVPGRGRGEKEGWQIELEGLKKKLKERDKEIEALKARIEEEKSLAHDAGFQKGKTEGIQAGESASKQVYNASLAELQQTIDRFLQDLTQEKSRLFLGFEKEALYLIDYLSKIMSVTIQ